MIHLHLFLVANHPALDHEREVIACYFNCGYTYEVIIDFMKKHHRISISLRTLKKWLKHYDLKQKNVMIDEESAKNLIKIEMANPGEHTGYRAIWHALRLIHLEIW